MRPEDADETEDAGGTGAASVLDFLRTETGGGVLLLVATAIALLWANSPWRAGYERLWHTVVAVHVGGHGVRLDLRGWVDEGLMSIFFLVVGLEVKRELLLGELRDRRRVALPVLAAVGGMVVPALLFLALNGSGPGARGWGIPMATDIAFAVAVLALVAPSLPSSARLFLLTLAIVDDIGAIVVIAVAYSSALRPAWFVLAAGAVGGVLLLRRTPIPTAAPFVALGVVLWFALHHAGVHPTIAGVVMGLLVPARRTARPRRRDVSELEWLEHGLHGWSSFVVVPVFAVANAGVAVGARAVADAATSPVALGIVVGLVAGKTAGITLASWLAVRLGLGRLPTGCTWRQLAGVAALGGIGFTVSLFVTGLAYTDPALAAEAKLGVLAASLLATALAAAILRVARG